MPQCENDYIQKTRDVMAFNRDLQNYILVSYTADMTKYTISAAEGAKIIEVYNSIPRQLARENPKFKLFVESLVKRKGARFLRRPDSI